MKIIEQVAKDSSQTVRRLQDFTRRRVPQELFKVDINSIIKDSIEITRPRWKDEAHRLAGSVLRVIPERRLPLFESKSPPPPMRIRS